MYLSPTSSAFSYTPRFAARGRSGRRGGGRGRHGGGHGAGSPPRTLGSFLLGKLLLVGALATAFCVGKYGCSPGENYRDPKDVHGFLPPGEYNPHVINHGHPSDQLFKPQGQGEPGEANPFLPVWWNQPRLSEYHPVKYRK